MEPKNSTREEWLADVARVNDSATPAQIRRAERLEAKEEAEVYQETFAVLHTSRGDSDG